MCRNLERLKTMFRQILWYKFLFVKVIHFWGRRDSIFNLNNVWHHSNISKSLENFIIVMFYALTSPYLKKMYLFSRIGHLIIINNIERTRISRWFGQETEENMVRTRDWCGWPSSPPLSQAEDLAAVNQVTQAATRVGWGRESRVSQIVITATQICFEASALLNW